MFSSLSSVVPFSALSLSSIVPLFLSPDSFYLVPISFLYITLLIDNVRYTPAECISSKHVAIGPA